MIAQAEKTIASVNQEDVRPRELCLPVFTRTSHGTDSNLDRLKLLMTLFSLSQADLCRASGFSRPFLSRLLSGDLVGSERFWLKLNSRLLDLLSKTGTWCSVFKV